MIIHSYTADGPGPCHWRLAPGGLVVGCGALTAGAWPQSHNAASSWCGLSPCEIMVRELGSCKLCDQEFLNEVKYSHFRGAALRILYLNLWNGLNHQYSKQLARMLKGRGSLLPSDHFTWARNLALLVSTNELSLKVTFFFFSNKNPDSLSHN